MAVLRLFLVLVLACLTGYTLVVGSNHGWNLFPLFFSNIAKMTWSGQFNLDFMAFLGLTGVWVAWCHQFSVGGIALGVVAFFGGMMFLAPYLLWASPRAAGNAKVLLLGKERASR